MIVLHKIKQKYLGKSQKLIPFKLIGEGPESTIFAALYKTKFVALKVIHKYLLDEQKALYLLNEKEIGLSVDNPFLCKTLVVFDDVRFVGLIMELGEFGSLSSVLKRTKVLQKHIAVSVIAQIIIALDYLHENKIVYRDLKTDNIVITRGGWIKLIDFGYAAHCRNKRNTVCGTIQYLAPELILGKPYDMKIDQTESYATMWNILNKDIEIPLQNQTIIAFLNKTLIRNPRKRCSIHDLYFDDLFIGINWEKYKKEKGFNPCVVRLNWKECLKDADESVLAIVNPILHDM
ncbi:hypothetical protein QTN25_000086 [Entamoeba marina]